MKRHLQFHWWRYAAVILVSVIFWNSLFSALAAPKQTERINVLFVGEHLDAQALQTSLSSVLPESIREVTVTAVTFDRASYKPKLSSYAVTNDLVIIEESHMLENVGQSIFARLTDGMLARFPDTPVYTEQVEDQVTLSFGFVLGNTNNHFSACYSGSDPCYVFCSPDSVNFDTLNENGKPGNDGALQALQYLLEMTQ